MSHAHDFSDKMQDAISLRREAMSSGKHEDHAAAHEAFTALASHPGGKHDQKKQAKEYADKHESAMGGHKSESKEKSHGYKDAQAAADKASSNAKNFPSKEAHNDAKDKHLEALKAAKAEGGDNASARVSAHQSSADSHGEKAKGAGEKGGGAEGDRHEAALKGWVTRRAGG